LKSDQSYSRQFYGRNHEMDFLDRFVKNYGTSNESLLLVKGSVGIGKTALVNHFLKRASEDFYLHCTIGYNDYPQKDAFGSIIEIGSDAFDLLAKNCFSAFKSGLHILNSRLTSEELADFCLLFPRLKVYFNYVEISSSAPTIDRINSLITTLLKVISEVLIEAKRKLIFFIDDLHGMDAETTKFLEKWLSTSISGAIIWIGAVVDDIEVPDFWSKKSTFILHIEVLELKGLNEDEIGLLVEENYPFSNARKNGFIEIIKQLTTGNPLEIKMLLPALADVGVLYYDPQAECWDYNLEQIYKIDRSNKSLNYLIRKMDDLSPTAQLVLSAAAVIGYKFNTTILGVSSKIEPNELNNILKDCCDRLLIEKVPEKESGVKHVYRFLNIQLRNAAYDRLTEEKKRRIHFTLGKTYLASLGYAARERNIVDIVDQFNKCITYFNSAKDRLELVEMNLQAGKKSKVEENFDAAQHYFTQAIQLIESNRQIWSATLVFDVYIQSGEVAFLMSDYVSSVMFFESALKYTTTSLEKAKVHYHFLVMQNAVCDVDEAWKSGLQALELLGFPFQIKISAAKQLGYFLYLKFVITRKRFPKIKDWKLLEDDSKELRIAIYMELIQTSRLKNEALSLSLIYKTFQLIVKEGITPKAYFVFTGMAIGARVHLKHYNKSLFYMSLAEDLMIRFPHARSRSRILHDQFGIYGHYIKHVTSCREQLAAAYEVAVAAGDQGSAARITVSVGMLMFFEGLPIQTTKSVLQGYIPFIQRAGSYTSKSGIDALSDALGILSGERSTDSNGSIWAAQYDSNEFIELKYVSELAHLFVALVMKKRSEANSIYSRLKSLEYRSYTIFHFLEKICELLILVDDINPSHSRKQALQKMAKLSHEFESLARDNPANFSFPSLLSRALIAEVNGSEEEAISEYRGAIAAAAKFQFVHFNALVNERIATILVKLKRGAEGEVHLKAAQNLYRMYGANAKVDQLDELLQSNRV